MQTPARSARARVSHHDAGGSWWQVAQRTPAPAVAQHIHEYVGYRERSGAPSLRREVSGSRVVFILDLGPPVLVRDPDGLGARFPTGFVAGLSDRYSAVLHDGTQEGIQLDLSPVGARLLFDMPLSELTNQVLALDEVLRDQRDLTARLRELHDWDARFDLLDRELSRRLIAPPSTLTQVARWAVDHIEAAGGAIDVRSLAHELGYSERQVGRIFREYVGVGPKRFARVVRFDRLVRAAERQPERRWSELALAFGFADQAHLTREVKALCGLTPTELRAERADIGELFR